MIFRTLLSVLVLCLAAAGQASAADETPRTVRIGVLAVRGEVDANQTWQSTVDFLSRSLPQYRFSLITGSAAALTAAVAARQLEFVITNPGHYLELRVDYAATAIATERDFGGPEPSETTAATVIALADRFELQTLSDLRGQTVSAAFKEAFGFQAVWREFQERGIDPFKDLKVSFQGFPLDDIVKSVRSGAASAGIIRSCVLEQMIQEGLAGKDEFKVVGRRPAIDLNCQVSTRLYPGWPFVRTAHAPQDMADRIREALLAMQPGADEKVWSPAVDYGSVRELYRDLRIGPYAPFTRLGIEDFIYANRYWAMLAAIVILAWLIQVTRVSYLVKKRTRQLNEAHEAARLRGEQMEHAARLSLMGEMASSLAHEINQPLAAILTYARACERKIAGGADVKSISDVVERIAMQAERAGQIVSRMREFVRKNPALQKPCDTSKILNDALALFEPSATAAQIEIIRDYPGDLPRIVADPVQIEEVILNLLQNAVDAVSGQVERKIYVAARSTADVVEICVRDSGRGFTAAEQERIFEAFFTTKPRGLGLGLSLSRSIVEAHGGRLDASRTADDLTEFRVTLPRMETAQSG